MSLTATVYVELILEAARREISSCETNTTRRNLTFGIVSITRSFGSMFTSPGGRRGWGGAHI